MVQFPLLPLLCYLSPEDPKRRQKIPWLCTSIASFQERPRGKKSSPVPESPRKKSSSREITRQNYSLGLQFQLVLLFAEQRVFGRNKVSFQQRFLLKEKEAREHCSLDHISKKTVSCVSHFPECKTLLWAHAGEEKELIQKSKGRRKNMPDAKKEKELLSRWKKAVF